jgi:hypothetical protein
VLNVPAVSIERGFRPPKHARRAWRAFWIIGTIECVAGFAVLGAEGVSNRWIVGVGAITVGCALFGIGHALSRRKRWAHRAAVTVIVLQITIGLLGPGRVTAPVLSTILLYLLLTKDTRHWVSGNPELDRLEAIDDREAQRARRRLQPDEIDLRAITDRMSRPDHDDH